MSAKGQEIIRLEPVDVSVSVRDESRKLALTIDSNQTSHRFMLEPDQAISIAQQLCDRAQQLKLLIGDDEKRGSRE